MQAVLPAPEYGQRRTLHLLYDTLPGRILLRPLVQPGFSRAMGFLLSTPLSRGLVRPFAEKNRIDLRDYPQREYRSFNDFFTRKILPGRRPVDMERGHLIAPCDGRLTVVQADSRFSIKGVSYRLSELLRDEQLAEEFSGGTLLIFRLTPAEYHRYIFPIDGVQSVETVIPGRFHTVDPLALHREPVYRENTRHYVLLRRGRLRLLQMEVGALMVGKITNTVRPGPVRRGQEKGYFEFGGSTVVLLLPSGAAELQARFRENSALGRETPVRMGEQIGCFTEAAG